MEKTKRQINTMLKNCKTGTVRHPSGMFSCGKKCIISGIARIGGRGWGWVKDSQRQPSYASQDDASATAGAGGAPVQRGDVADI